MTLARLFLGFAALGATSLAGAQDPAPLYDQAVQALRAKRNDVALAKVNEGLAMADKMRPGDARVWARTRAGQLLWSLNERPQAEKVLLVATKEIDATPTLVSARTQADTYRMLGIVYRDLGRASDAVPWLQRAVAVGRAAPESQDDKYFMLASNLQELASQQCRAGLVSSSEATDKERLDACRRSRNPKTVGACTEAPRTCTASGWMRGERQAW